MSKDVRDQLLKAVSVTGLKSLTKYLDFRIKQLYISLERAEVDDFKIIQGRLRELRSLSDRIDYLIKN